jgi:hypothetical protein
MWSSLAISVLVFTAGLLTSRNIYLLYAGAIFFLAFIAGLPVDGHLQNQRYASQIELQTSASDSGNEGDE